MSNSTDISVVLSVKDGAKYIKDAVESILTQTHKDFEFIIINDGSTDETAEILESFQDERITIITHSTAKGISTSVNKGLALAKGSYIARMDADDISAPQRLQKQFEYMENNPECVALGCSYHLMDENSHIYRKAYSNFSDDECRFMLMFNYPFCNPSLMLRKATLDKHQINYNEDLPVAEDHDLLIRLAAHGKIGCLKDYLFIYRTHTGGISKQKKELMCEKTVRLCLPYTIKETGLSQNLAPEIASFIELTCKRHPITSIAEIKNYTHTFNQILNAYLHSHKGKINPCVVQQGAAEFLFKKLIFKDKNIKKPVNLAYIFWQNKKISFCFLLQSPKMMLKIFG